MERNTVVVKCWLSLARRVVRNCVLPRLELRMSRLRFRFFSIKEVKKGMKGNAIGECRAACLYL